VRVIVERFTRSNPSRSTASKGPRALKRWEMSSMEMVAGRATVEDYALKMAHNQ